MLLLVMVMVQVFLISLFTHIKIVVVVGGACEARKNSTRFSASYWFLLTEQRGRKLLSTSLSLFHQNTKYNTQNTVRTSSNCAIGNHNRVRTIAAIEHGFFGIFVHASL